MNKLIFSILKIAEVALTLAFAYYLIYEPLVRDILVKLSLIMGYKTQFILNNIIIVLCIVFLIRRGHLKAWISANKIWSKAIVNSITKRKLKAYFVFLTTGWRSVEVFGHPKKITGVYMVCLKSKWVSEFNFSNWNHEPRWYKIGVGDECKENPVIFWKPLPKVPKC